MGKRTTLKVDWPFPHAFERGRYSDAWLRVPHDEVKEIQPVCLAYLVNMGFHATITDSGAGTLRGRIRGTLTRSGNTHLIGQVMKGQAGAGGAGLVDIIGCSPKGLFIAIECKAPMLLTPDGCIAKRAGLPTEAQLEYLMAAHRRGAIAGVVWSLSDLQGILTSFTVGRIP
jgi:hypothetical protein